MNDNISQDVDFEDTQIIVLADGQIGKSVVDCGETCT